MTHAAVRGSAAVPWNVLRGRRVIVTRPPGRETDLMALLTRAGARPLHCPAASLAPLASWTALDRELQRCASFDWIAWSSVHAVHAVEARAREVGLMEHLQAARHAVVGPATARALGEAQLHVSFVASGGHAQALAAELPAVAGDSVLLPRSDMARRELPDGLAGRGVRVTEVVAYVTTSRPSDVDWIEHRSSGADLVTFCSPSAARGFIDAWESSGVVGAQPPRVVCLGRSSAAASVARGWVPAAVAVAPTMEDLMDALTRVVACDD